MLKNLICDIFQSIHKWLTISQSVRKTKLQTMEFVILITYYNNK